MLPSSSRCDSAVATIEHNATDQLEAAHLICRCKVPAMNVNAGCILHSFHCRKSHMGSDA
jgi:hypothetical protein